MVDRYRNFAELQNGETEGVDYRICVTEQESYAAIIAPHGGWIEPGTSEIAAAIAGNIHSLYCFEGLRNRPHEDLHITSTRFDEPKCQGLIKRCKIIVAVHGLDGGCKVVDIGGRDKDLRDMVCASLDAACFQSKVVTNGNYAAVSQKNICNRGKRGKGVQIEIYRGLRDALRSGEKDLNTFAESVRQAIRNFRTTL